jgi:hypothetical protein
MRAQLFMQMGSDKASTLLKQVRSPPRTTVLAKVRRVLSQHESVTSPSVRCVA